MYCLAQKLKLSLVRHLPRVQPSRVISSILLSLAVIAAIVVLVKGGGELLRQPLHLDPFLVTLSVLVACCGLLLVAIPVWRRILTSYGIHRSVRDDVRNYCYGALGVALPGSIWSIVGRSALYARQGVSGLHVATASVVESLVVGVAATIVYAIASIIRPGASFWQRPEIVIGFAMLASVLIHPRIFNGLVSRAWKLTKRPGEPLAVNCGSWELAAWIGLEAVVTVIGGIALFVLLLGFTAVPSWMLIQIIEVWAIAVVAGNLFFWLPGTFILRDGVFVIALAQVMSLPAALIFALLARLWTILSLLILATFVWLIFDSPHKLHKFHHHR